MDAKMQSVKEYWDSRAELGPEAGTQDLIARQLEVRAIEEYVKDGMTILDAGCGNGMTALELAERHKVNIIGMDFAPKMIGDARELANKRKLKGPIHFGVWDITDCFLNYQSMFDLVYTQRAIINLPDWETQKKTIELLGTYLKPGGKYLMCECSQDGLDEINQLRKQIELDEIKSPWHNRYLRDKEVMSLAYEAADAFGSQKNVGLQRVHDFSSTYYYLSRIINAWLAAQEGKEPDYNSPINQLSLQLPSFGNCGQVKLWVWQKI